MPGLRVSPLRIFHSVVNGTEEAPAKTLSSAFASFSNRKRTSSALGIDVTMPDSTETGRINQPESEVATGILDGVNDPINLKPVLQQNLLALMRARWGKENRDRLRGFTRRGGTSFFGAATATRLMELAPKTSLETLAACAHTLGVEPWQLLVRDLDPASMPRLERRVFSPQAADLAEQLDRLTDPMKRQKAYAVALAVIKLVDEGREPPAPFSPET